MSEAAMKLDEPQQQPSTPSASATSSISTSSESEVPVLVENGKESFTVNPEPSKEPEKAKMGKGPKWSSDVEEGFQAHMRMWTGPKMGSMNLERKRYLLLVAALKDNDSPAAIARLRNATKVGDLKVAEAAKPHSQLKSMSDLLRDNRGNVRDVMADMSAQTDKIRDKMVEEGTLV
jgi:hypothetical protein